MGKSKADSAGYRKKLIEVALPLQAINEGSKPETENPFLKGHPRAIHNWWARTPLSVCRAVLFAQLIDDPGNDLPQAKATKQRVRLLEIIENLATWDGMTDNELLKDARNIINQQFDGTMPEFWDMFAGRGSIPLEAARLGLKVTSSDLNPVAVLINKCLLEIAAKFVDKRAVHPITQKTMTAVNPCGFAGLIDDIRFYGQWIQAEAKRKIGSHYPQVTITSSIVKQQPELRPYAGSKLNVLAWLWARTIKCPNPACGARLPMVASFQLSKKQSIYLEPIIDQRTSSVTFRVRLGTKADKGTSDRNGARCLFCSTKLKKAQVREQASAHGVDEVPMAVVCEGNRECVYVPFDPSSVPHLKRPDVPAIDQPLTDDRRWFSPPLYGMPHFVDLFTPRQLTVLSAFTSLIAEARDKATADAAKSGTFSPDGHPLWKGGKGAVAYGDALATYLACALSRLTDYSCSLATWNPTNENIRNLFQRQAIPMAWDFAEANVMDGKLTFENAVEWIVAALEAIPVTSGPARVVQLDARHAAPTFDAKPVVSTDPPYYDNIGYADLSDFFYVWLRFVLRGVDPQLFSTMLTPKDAELIASRVPARWFGRGC